MGKAVLLTSCCCVQMLEESTPRCGGLVEVLANETEHWLSAGVGFLHPETAIPSRFTKGAAQ